MKFLKNLSLRAELAFGFGIVVMMMVILAAFSLSRMQVISEAVRYQEQLQRDQLDPLYAAREALDQTGVAARNAFIFADDAAATRELDIVDKQRALYLVAIETLAPHFKGDAQFDKVREGMLAMARELDRPRKYRQLADMHGFGEFLVNECSPLRRRIVTDIDVLLKSKQKESAAAANDAEALFSRAIAMVSTVTVLTFLLCLLIGWAITRSMMRQLGGEPAYAAAIADRIAHGELTLDVKTRAGDSTSLLYSIRSMRDNLANIVGQVRRGTDSMGGASAEIASGNHDLSNRTEQQADALVQVSQAMDDLTSTVRQNADSAARANVLAQSASGISQEGGRVVNEVVQTMADINGASRKIVDIISVIDGIAFQTNILALNAAVEAARAGEQGRGFAVVASEVRSLAQRSASAAKEIKILIEDSVGKVDSGTMLVGRAGETMRKVVESITLVTDIMAKISEASRDQTNGIEQINVSINAIDSMTQQNTALVEEAAAAAQEMQRQATELAQVVGLFKIAPKTARNEAQTRKFLSQ